MCRLIGVVAREPAPLSNLFGDDLAPFLAQACEHSHGWGVASRTAQGAVASYKDPVRADESALFHPTLDGLTTQAGMLHLRMASPGSPVRRGNTHPFGDSQMAFIHNGDFAPSSCLDDVIGGALSAAEGDTDSERFYLAVRRRIEDGMEPPKALATVGADIQAMATRFASLNCMLLTSEALYAYTAHDPLSEVIGRRGAGYFSLNYRRDADKVVVASTGWPQDPPRWTTIPEGLVVEIRRSDLSTVVHNL
jgi:predicted glutamine amidotransferase